MTTTEPPYKKRTSQCREWERNRRNKFNDAITKLGETVRQINKANEPSSNESEACKNEDNVKYPKIEIIHKAILCLTNCAQEKTQLRTEILALQVKLDGNKCNKKDTATQVHIEIHKKNKNGKCVKLLMTQKDKINNKKEKIKPLKENKVENAPAPKLPSILPRYNIFNKKAPENAIVVLPATPYIFPQRPLLFPTGPPAIVVVDNNTLQTFNKSVPIVTRNSGDITKTTMVNILPISAYSRPLSATKNKRNNLKVRTDCVKKLPKKNKGALKTFDDLGKNVDNSTCKPGTQERKEEVTKASNVTTNVTVTTGASTITIDTSLIKIVTTKEEIVPKNTQITNIISIEDKITPKDDTISKSTEKPQLSDLKNVQKNIVPITSSSNKNIDVIPTESVVKTNILEEIKCDKSSVDKTASVEEKNKENKLPNLLDPTLCDNVVDGGNARLELAEEFLAASPTAAFLMTFPLVSGNRADSPAEEPPNITITTSHHTQVQSKDNGQKRNDLIPHHVHTTTTAYLGKPNITDSKITQKPNTTKSLPSSKSNEQDKLVPISKAPEVKSMAVSNENPFLNLPMPSLISTNCTLSDTGFGLDFDCNISKPSQATPYVSNSNIFYKNDPFSTVKNTIYSTSSISSSHEFNSLGLYPCAMEKYTSKNKSDFSNMDDNNLMKIGSSRLTYDIDLGWSHKGFDFVNCTTTAVTFTKDNILTTVSSTPICTSYNPFNPEFHVPLISSSNKKDGTNKVSSSFADALPNFYSQPSNLWPEEPFYTSSNNVPKTFTTRHQNYLPLENAQPNSNVNKQSNVKHYEVKDTSTNVNNAIKSTSHSIGQQVNEKYTKKSPNKMHINWMTSEIRPMQSNCNAEIKEPHKMSYNHSGTSKRHETNEGYFPLSMHNFTSQTPQEDFNMWPSARPLGTTEISIDPPPINLPTLVGDLALGPHDKKKNLDSSARVMPQQDIQNCTNFFSVTQLMNRSNDNSSSRYQPPQIETSKAFLPKQNIPLYTSDSRKVIPSRVDSNISQPYVFNDPKLTNSYDNMGQFSQAKKPSSKLDKNSKTQKNNYSAEALLRGGNFTHKIHDNSNKFLPHPQKYSDFNSTQDTSVAQVSHFPAIIDYTDNTYTGQQLSGTSLYNTTTNTISNSFYSNFMPASSNIMSSNYTTGHFPGEFIDYNQPAECNYSNHKYEDLKMRNNPQTFPNEKVPYKSTRRESGTKHKLECSKKDSNKKYPSKRTKTSNEVDEWNDPHSLWQNKASSRKHPNLMSEELPFPNYVSSQMPSQYQPDFFNSHLMSSNMQPMGHNVDRSIASLPITSRANFNLSTIFPEITMKVQ